MVNVFHQAGMSNRKLNLLKQELKGKMQFAQLVLGNTEVVHQAEQAYEDALFAKEDYESANWLEIPY